MILARIGNEMTSEEQAAAQEATAKASRFEGAMSALRWLAIGGGTLFLYTAINKGRSNADRS